MLQIIMKEWDIHVLRDYVASQAGALKIHVESKHEGDRYPCPNVSMLQLHQVL